MNENPSKLTTAEVKRFSDIFEKTLLELFILDSLYGNNDVREYVENVFQASIEDLRDSGTLTTLAATFADDNEQWTTHEKYEQTDKQELRRSCPNDEQHVKQEYVSLEKELQKLKRKEEDIDALIEKCAVRLFKPTNTFI